jgi:hypothetical protein
MRKKVFALTAAFAVAVAGFALALLMTGGASAIGFTATGSTTDDDFTTSSSTTTTPTLLGLHCELADRQPPEPLELTTSHVDRVFPIISTVMEKEVSNCTRAAGNQVRDFETIIRLETSKGQPVPGTQPDVETTLCVKDLGTGSVICSVKNVIVGPPLSKPLKGCSQGTQQPDDPVGMDSIDLGSFGEKLVKVEKEVLTCPNSRIADLYLFTLRETRPDDVTTFFGIVCFKVPTSSTPPTTCNTVTTS